MRPMDQSLGSIECLRRLDTCSESDDMLKFALIGCGRIAKRHSELLGNHQIEGAQLAAVCDIIPERAQAIGERFSVPWFADMHQMLQTQDFDIAVILTESGRHAEH